MTTIIDRLQHGISSHSVEQTQQIAQEFAAVIPDDWVLALHGTLGVGKTSFVRGLALAWGITSPITSPTYNFFNIYEGTRKLIHMDAYRLEIGEDMSSLMLEDFLQHPYGFAIEWPANMDLSPYAANTWNLEFSINKSDRSHHIRLVLG